MMFSSLQSFIAAAMSQTTTISQLYFYFSSSFGNDNAFIILVSFFSLNLSGEMRRWLEERREGVATVLWVYHKGSFVPSSLPLPLSAAMQPLMRRTKCLGTVLFGILKVKWGLQLVCLEWDADLRDSFLLS